MSRTNSIDSSPAGKSATGPETSPLPKPGFNIPDGGHDVAPKPPIKLTRELLKARAAGAPTITPGPPPSPDYDGFDDGDGADRDDGYEDYAALRDAVEAGPAGAAGAEPRFPSNDTVDGAQVAAAARSSMRMYESSRGPAGFSFSGKLRKFAATQDAVHRMLAGPRERLVAYLARRLNVLRLARPHLRPEHFSLPDEETHRIMVRQLYLLHDAGQIPAGGPTFAAILGPLAELMAGNGDGAQSGLQASYEQARMEKLAASLYGEGGGRRGARPAPADLRRARRGDRRGAGVRPAPAVPRGAGGVGPHGPTA